MSKIYTCEAVSDGHPDKLCDQFADSIVTDCLKHDKNSRVAIECLLKDRDLVIAGELTSKHHPDYEKLVYEVLERIGLEKLNLNGYDKPLKINVLVKEQSPDIALGVDKGGAGDQGIMYGYATNETSELMPIPYMLATKFLELLKNHPSKMFRADAKAQVSYDYISGRITTFLCSVQHSADVKPDDFRTIIENMMVDVATKYGLNSDFEKLVNPTGRFVQGGSFADCGVTGRKLACDTYGGLGRIGGGAFCVDKDTEFLTPYGFKKMTEYKEGDMAAQWNFGNLEFVKPLAYVKTKAEPMYHIRTSDALDMVLSEHHDMLIITSKGNVIKKPVCEVFENGGIKRGNHGFIPVSFKYDKKKGNLKLTDDEIRLQIAFCADGTIIKEKDDICRVRVKKERKKERMRMLLNVTETKYTETFDGDYSIFWFVPPVRSRKLKYCFQDATTNQLQVIAEEVQLWDGSKNAFYTTHKSEADFVQFVFMAAYGTNASIVADNRVGQRYKGGKYIRKSICYTVYRKNTTITNLRGGQNEKLTLSCEEFIPSDGMMYCFTMPAGTLVLRRNDKVFITGNCGKDPSKVDRSAAYMVRKIARDIVQMGYADKCEIQIAYAIGVAEPVSVAVDCFGTERKTIDFIEQFVKENYDLRPKAIIERLGLLGFDYNKVSAYGHFGKVGLPWEE